MGNVVQDAAHDNTKPQGKPPKILNSFPWKS
jgi:hypothetical protein